MLTIILSLLSSVRSIRGEPVESCELRISTRLSFLTIRGMLLIPQMHKPPGDASRLQRDDADRAAVVAVETIGSVISQMAQG